jgi:hypothetical protein
VVRKEPNLAEAETITFAQTMLAAYKVPKRVVFVSTPWRWRFAVQKMCLTPATTPV